MQADDIGSIRSPYMLRELHLQSLEGLAKYLKGFIPPDLSRMDTVQEAFALSALSKAISTTEAYLLLVREGYWEEGRILSRTIVEVLLNCFWVQKNEKEQLRRVGSLIIDHEQSKIKRMKNFLEFERTSLPPGQISTERMEEVLQRKETYFSGLLKSLAHQYGINPDYVKKTIRTKMEDKVKELGISPYYLDIYSSASESVHAGTAALEAYTKNPPSGQRTYEGAFPYDIYTVDAIYTLLIEAAHHTVEVYPMFRGSTFSTTMAHHKALREALLSRGIELEEGVA